MASVATGVIRPYGYARALIVMVEESPPLRPAVLDRCPAGRSGEGKRASCRREPGRWAAAPRAPWDGHPDQAAYRPSRLPCRRIAPPVDRRRTRRTIR